MTKGLPPFRLIPDPIAAGVVEASDEICAACKQARGTVATAGLYSARDPGAICPWCVADGRAAKLFDGAFQPGLEAAERLPKAVQDEALHRTPGLVTWQDWPWPADVAADGRADACVLLGEVEGAALLAEGDAAKIEACLAALSPLAAEPEAARERLGDLEPAGAVTLFLFAKPISGGYRAILDFD